MLAACQLIPDSVSWDTRGDLALLYCLQQTSWSMSSWHYPCCMRCFAVVKPPCSFISIYSTQQPRKLIKEHGVICLVLKVLQGKESCSRSGSLDLSSPGLDVRSFTHHGLPPRFQAASLSAVAVPGITLMACKGGSSYSMSSTLFGIHSPCINEAHFLHKPSLRCCVGVNV